MIRKGLPFSAFVERGVLENVPQPPDSPPGSVAALRLHLPTFVRALRNREPSTATNGYHDSRLEVQPNENRIGMPHLKCAFRVLSGQPDAPLLNQRTIAPGREQ